MHIFKPKREDDLMLSRWPPVLFVTIIGLAMVGLFFPEIWRGSLVETIPAGKLVQIRAGDWSTIVETSTGDYTINTKFGAARGSAVEIEVYEWGPAKLCVTTDSSRKCFGMIRFVKQEVDVDIHLFGYLAMLLAGFGLVTLWALRTERSRAAKRQARKAKLLDAEVDQIKGQR